MIRTATQSRKIRAARPRYISPRQRRARHDALVSFFLMIGAGTIAGLFALGAYAAQGAPNPEPGAWCAVLCFLFSIASLGFGWLALHCSAEAC